jgi:BirA family biotin operon repressor/biotin-[acetyl-CoA-carboxylase] ligase
MRVAEEASTAMASRTVDASDSPPAGASGESDVIATSFDGIATPALRELLRVPAVHAFSRAGSTLDVAHRLAAAGAPHGALVIADAQTRGRGRGGKHWSSPPGTGLWLTLVARPATADSIRVLTVRLGLAVATVLDRFATHRVQLKWPNDLYVDGGKLGGLLVEARWRGAVPEWLAVGVGINVRAPVEMPGAAGLVPGTGRVAVLAAVVPAVIAALARLGPALADHEVDAYASRDMVAGRRAAAPASGVILGINAAAELRIATTAGEVAISSGSLVLSEVP